jgi:hypothetical protein
LQQNSSEDFNTSYEKIVEEEEELGEDEVVSWSEVNERSDVFLSILSLNKI